ncbi:hypothetical protein JDV09_11805 [Mycobacterium sp. Y57]|uniref:hypothetical protein n=1 Tax=Mycolicibacterium xanthum TaxID=2796469 RepID=UPI001C850B97|nr:hypothetical protein [Mycolicibacterium xanthum]MBX7432784.1 hypothetical protein [Mycolicibacterium xanthum]
MRNPAVAVAVAITVVAAGCGSDPVPDSTPAGVDRSDPDQVISTALETMFTWAPAQDASPNDALERASGLLTSDLAEQAGGAPEPGPGSQWEQWRADGAVVEATAYFVADETPPNSADRAHRVVVIVQSATTPDHRLINETRHTAWVVADRSDGGWRVSSIDF